MRRPRITTETILLAFLVVSILWKGGKALDVVWLQALTAAVLTLLTLHRKKEEGSPVPPFFGFLLFALSGWTVLSFVFSTTQNYGFDEVLQTVSLSLIAIFAAGEIQRNPAFPLRFAKTLSIATLLACSVGLIVYVLQPVSRFSGTFFDYRFHTDYWPNAWAEFVLLAWPVMAWTLFLRTSRPIHQVFDRDWIKAAVLGLVLGCLFLSFSRGGFIAFSGQILLLCALGLFFRRTSFSLKRVAMVSSMTLTMSIVVFLGMNSIRSQFHTVESVVQKVTFSSAEGASSVSERESFWKQSFALAMQKPAFGWGPYSFRFVQPHLQSEILATSDHPHNIFLKYASERGLPAAAFLLLLLVFVGYCTVHGLARPKRKHEALTLRAFFLVSIAGVLAHNLIDYNLQFVGIAFPLWLMIGLLVSRPLPKKSRHHTYVMTVVAFALLFFTIYEGANLFLSSFARHADARGEAHEALRWYSWVDASLFPRDARLSQGAILMSLGQLPQAEDAVSKYVYENAKDGRAWRLLGDIYLQWNKRFDALRAYEQAYRFAKFNDAGILRGLVYLQEDVDRDSLISRRHDFDELINDYGLAIQQNTHFIALSSSVEELVSLCDLMARYFPEESELYRSLAREITEHAKEERAKTASRPLGFLW